MPHILAALVEGEEEDAAGVGASDDGIAANAVAAGVPPTQPPRSSRLGRQASSTRIGLGTLPPSLPLPPPLPVPQLPPLPSPPQHLLQQTEAAPLTPPQQPSSLPEWPPSGPTRRLSAGSSSRPQSAGGGGLSFAPVAEDDDEPPAPPRQPTSPSLSVSRAGSRSASRRGSLMAPTEEAPGEEDETEGQESTVGAPLGGARSRSQSIGAPPAQLMPRLLTAGSGGGGGGGGGGAGSRRPSLLFASTLARVAENAPTNNDTGVMVPSAAAASSVPVVVNAAPRAQPHWEAVRRRREELRAPWLVQRAAVGAYEPVALVWAGTTEVAARRRAAGRPAVDEWGLAAGWKFPPVRAATSDLVGPGSYAVAAAAATASGSAASANNNASHTSFASAVPRFLPPTSGTTAAMRHVGPGAYAVSTAPWVERIVTTLGRALAAPQPAMPPPLPYSTRLPGPAVAAGPRGVASASTTTSSAQRRRRAKQPQQQQRAVAGDSGGRLRRLPPPAHPLSR
ncbi:hypothetical protein HK405_011531, partial [Cladochytrium tenue]